MQGLLIFFVLVIAGAGLVYVFLQSRTQDTDDDMAAPALGSKTRIPKSGSSKQQQEQEEKAAKAIDWKAQVEFLLQKAQQDPGNLETRYKLAEAQIRAGRIKAGLENVHRILDKNLETKRELNINALLLASEAMKNAGKLEEALRYAKSAYGIDPEDLEVNRRLAILEYDLGHLNDCFAHAYFLLKGKPEHPDALLYTGMASFRLGRHSQAAEYLNSLVHLDENNFQGQLFLGKAYDRMGEIVLAEKHYNLALKNAYMDEEQSDVFYAWGLLNKRNGNTRMALDNFNNALKTVPEKKRKLVLQELIDIYESEKDFSKAIWALKDYLKLEPRNDSIRARMEQYLEHDAHTRMQKYELLAPHQFLEFCQEITPLVIKVNGIVHAELNSDETVDIMVESSENSLPFTCQFRFARTVGEIGDMPVRDLYSKMKANRCARAIFIVNSEFTRDAHEFCKGININLISGEELQHLLEKMKPGSGKKKKA